MRVRSGSGGGEGSPALMPQYQLLRSSSPSLASSSSSSSASSFFSRNAFPLGLWSRPFDSPGVCVVLTAHERQRKFIMLFRSVEPSISGSLPVLMFLFGLWRVCFPEAPTGPGEAATTASAWRGSKARCRGSFLVQFSSCVAWQIPAPTPPSPPSSSTFVVLRQ